MFNETKVTDEEINEMEKKYSKEDVEKINERLFEEDQEEDLTTDRIEKIEKYREYRIKNSESYSEKDSKRNDSLIILDELNKDVYNAIKKLNDYISEKEDIIKEFYEPIKKKYPLEEVVNLTNLYERLNGTLIIKKATLTQNVTFTIAGRTDEDIDNFVANHTAEEIEKSLGIQLKKEYSEMVEPCDPREIPLITIVNEEIKERK